MKIVLASSNVGKIRELSSLLAPYNIEIIPQSAFNIPDAEETGLTFIENAILKARHAAKLTGLPAIADDSGLAVKALNGAPGIYSARYAGSHGDPTANIHTLLANMEQVPDDQRQACFHCALVFLNHADDPTPIVCDGIWHGTILRKPHGVDGFGYDPIFYIPTLKLSAAEIDKAEKNKISHRGMAMQKLLQGLKNQL